MVNQTEITKELLEVVEVKKSKDLNKVNQALENGWKLLAIEKSIDDPVPDEIIYYHLGRLQNA